MQLPTDQQREYLNCVTARKIQRLKQQHPINGDGYNYALEKVLKMLDADTPLAGVFDAAKSERLKIEAERAELQMRLEAENLSRRENQR